MNPLNMAARQNADGSKHIEAQLHGVMDGGWVDEDSTSTAKIIAFLQEHPDAATITLRVNSVGGSAFGGIAVASALKAHPAEVTAIVEGLAASAASVALMGADRVVMGSKASMMMIHGALAATLGDANDHREQAEILDKVSDAIAELYADRARRPLEDIKAMLAAETWLTAAEAVELGLADEIADERVDAESEGDSVIVNAVAFPRASVPNQILALANKPAPTRPAAPPVTSPDLTNAVDARAQVLAEERGRVAAILALDVPVNADLVRAAIRDGSTPDQLLANLYRADLATNQAANKAMAQRIDARRRESEILATVRQSAPERTTEDLERQAGQRIAEHVNRRLEER